MKAYRFAIFAGILFCIIRQQHYKDKSSLNIVSFNFRRSVVFIIDVIMDPLFGLRRTKRGHVCPLSQFL